MQKQFDFYNDLIFDNAVPYCEITLKKKLPKKAMGLFYSGFDENGNKTYLIELSLDYDNLGLTLVHEMIHALQWAENRPVNHHKYFKQWVKFISNEWGLDV